MRFYFIFFLLFNYASHAKDKLDLNQIEQEVLDNVGNIQFHEDKWSVDSSKIDIEDAIYKQGVDRDLTDWDNLDVDKWVDIKTWMEERKIKDDNPRWRAIVRNSLTKEIMARVIKCIGVCTYFHGLSTTQASYQTIIREGDEFITEKDSYAWIAMMDGSLVRVSPKTSITFTEVNISKEKIFYLVRLNNGHLNWQTRLKGEFLAQDKPETDMSFFPLMLKDANREFYAIQEYRSKTEEEKLQFSIEKNPGHVSQYKALNEKINSKQREQTFKKDIELFIYSPNASFILKNSHISLFYAVNGKSFYNISKDIINFQNTDNRAQEATGLMRGFENTKSYSVEWDKWTQVSRDGQAISSLEKTNQLETMDSFSMRIPTVHLAREAFVEKYSLDLLDPTVAVDKISSQYSYRVWDFVEKDELKRRLSYVTEYIRRVETRNLINLEKLFKTNTLEELDKSFYANAMRRHYEKLRFEYNKSHQSVREMTNNEYYLWMIRNAR